MATLGSIAGILPGMAQMGLGAFQGIGEIITQLINAGIRSDVAGQLERETRGAYDRYLQGGDGVEGLLPILDRSTQQVRDLMGRRVGSFADNANRLSEARNTAISGLRDIVPEVRGRVDEALSRRDRDIGNTRRLLDEAVVESRGFLSDTLRETSELFGEMRSRADAVLSGIRTNMTERAGATVGGIRSGAAQRSRELVSRARAEGRMSDTEIAVMENNITEEANKEAANFWGGAFTTMSEQLATAGVAGNNMLSSLGSNLRSIVTSMRDSVSRVAMGAAATEEQMSASRAELAGGLASLMSGTLEFVSDRVSNVVLSEAAAQVANTNAQTEFESATTNQLIALDGARASAVQYALDTLLNGIFQAGGIRAGISFTMPNIAGLMTPGLQMSQAGLMNTALRPSQEQKGGFSISVLGTGGGSSCIDVFTMVMNGDGYMIPFTDVRVGMSVMGGDGRPHTVINIDRGSSPEEHRVGYVNLVTSIGSLTITKDHTIAGNPASNLSVGDVLNTLTGPVWILRVTDVPYRPGGDLDLKGCPTYIANGFIVDSVIAKATKEAKRMLFELAESKGLVLESFDRLHDATYLGADKETETCNVQIS